MAPRSAVTLPTLESTCRRKIMVFTLAEETLPTESRESVIDNTSNEKSEKKHKCPEPGCDCAFTRPSKLARHIRGHTGLRPYKCEHEGCDKAYTNGSHLKRHAESHRAIKLTYQCGVCSLLLSNRHNLKRHYERIHGEKRPLQCEDCGLKFKKERLFKEHKESGPLYKCDECDRQFRMLKEFKKHSQQHQHRKSYPCPVAECSEIFHKWSLRVAHVKSMHERSYKCKDCEKSFAIKRDLRTHSVVHQEHREVLECPYEHCPRSYFFKRNLDHHVRTRHLGKRKYTCDVCGAMRASKRKLEEHIVKIHQSKRPKRSPGRMRARRRDAGVPKRSMVSKLVGLNLPAAVEKCLLRRETSIVVDKEFERETRDSSAEPKEVTRSA